MIICKISTTDTPDVDIIDKGAHVLCNDTC